MKKNKDLPKVAWPGIYRQDGGFQGDMLFYLCQVYKIYGSQNWWIKILNVISAVLASYDTKNFLLRASFENRSSPKISLLILDNSVSIPSIFAERPVMAKGQRFMELVIIVSYRRIIEVISKFNHSLKNISAHTHEIFTFEPWYSRRGTMRSLVAVRGFVCQECERPPIEDTPHEDFPKILDYFSPLAFSLKDALDSYLGLVSCLSGVTFKREIKVAKMVKKIKIRNCSVACYTPFG